MNGPSSLPQLKSERKKRRSGRKKLNENHAGAINN
nr:MAG TPA: hypothetical protein [Caudoviricetes sp.]